MNGDAAVRLLPDGCYESGQRGRIADQHHRERVVRRGPRLPRRRAIRAVERVGGPLGTPGVLPEYEGLWIREARKGARRDLEHAVRRIFVQERGVERDDGRAPGPFHVGAECRAHERQRLVGTPLEQQVRAAPPLARGHVAEPHQRDGRREHRDDERHDDRETDGLVSDAPPAESQTPSDPRDGLGDRLPGLGARNRRRLGFRLDHRRISRSR